MSYSSDVSIHIFIDVFLNTEVIMSEDVDRYSENRSTRRTYLTRTGAVLGTSGLGIGLFGRTTAHKTEKKYCPNQPDDGCLECPNIGQAQYSLIAQSDSECSFERVTGSDEWDEVITNITKEPDDVCDPGFDNSPLEGPQSVCLETEYCLQGQVIGPFVFTELGPASPNEDGEICLSPPGENGIVSFTVRCVSDEQASCPPCEIRGPSAEYIDGEWVLNFDDDRISIEGDQQEVTICAEEELDCSLIYRAFGTQGCVRSIGLLCGECVTITSEQVGGDIEELSGLPGNVFQGCSLFGYEPDADQTGLFSPDP